ncbi:MAG: hypothetical protein LBE04_01735, partial [Prevotellaceae bacterium]|nr:hypothetical protein [Prevotellaceae bacterium]
PPQKKKIRILNSDTTKTIESDTGKISRFRYNVKIEHEGVIMECESAVLWPNGIFEAYGNTKVTSGATIVTGDVMIYSEITGKANVKGRIVYLTDGNSTLRTTEVDFDTGTEIGYFEYEGTIVDSFRTLESQKGYYYSKIKEFEFIGQVQSDTKDYVLQSDSMKYNTDTKLFTFYSNTHIWSKNGYLYCDKGWYDSDKNIMFFHRNSYMLTSKQEIFADTIYYEDEGQKGQLYSNVQVTDTVQKTVAMADFADFDMNAENFLMRRNPSIIMYDDKDSVFLRADTLYSVTRVMKIPVAKNDSGAKNDSVAFSGEMSVAKRDSIASLRKKPVVKRDSIAFQEKMVVAKNDSIAFLRKMAVAENDSIAFPEKMAVDESDSVAFPEKMAVDESDSVAFPEKMTVAENDSVAFPKKMTVVENDSVAFTEKISTPDITLTTSVPDSILPDMPDTMQHISDTPDTLQHISDSTQYVDSTYKEVFAFKNAKLYRSDFQIKSDSMYFNNLDSIWRIYHDPILWNGKQMQITSDSMRIYIINGDLEYADFNGNAMVVLPEGNPDTTIYFNQVKSKNMKAHFKNRELNLFEAMGNAQTLFFFLSDFLMNTTEATVFKIYFESGKVHHIGYYDGITGKNNPLYLVREDEIKLPGYRWEIDLRPKSGNDVLNRLLRPSERTVRESLSKPSFPITKRINELELKLNLKK